MNVGIRKKMKTKPINLKTHDVQALLAGRKTQHRAVVRPQPETLKKERCAFSGVVKFFDKTMLRYVKHPYDIGDLLWLREAFGWHELFKEYVYRATDEPDRMKKWKTPIQMPKRASRLTLKLTDIRVERLQDISEGDAIAEGCRSFFDKDNHEYLYCPNGSKIEAYPLKGAKEHYQRLWKSTHDKGSWQANPFVWVLEFEVINKNVDEALK